MIDDSDDEEHGASKQKAESKSQCLLQYMHARVLNIALGRLKKQRMSAILMDEEDEEDEEGMKSFSSRLTKFRKSPSKSCTLSVRLP